MTVKKKRSTAPMVTVIIIGAILAVIGFGPDSWFGAEESTTIQGASVTRGPLKISVVQRGNLSAKNSVQIRNELEGRTTILTLVPEGTRVEKGDLIAELDVSSIVDRKVQQEIQVQNAQATLTADTQRLEIQESQNESDIKAAEQRLEFAKQDLAKYIEGDYPQSLESATEAITLAKEELEQARTRYEYSQSLHEEGFLTRTELETDQLAYQRRGISLAQAERAKTLLEQFDHKRKLDQLNADIEEANRELARVKLQARARLVDFEAAVQTSRAKLQLEEDELAKLNDQIRKGTIYAPESGLVVYAREASRWGQGDPIAEGTELRERQEVVSIPREGGMIVEASLHESVIKKVRPGMPCIVRVDAIPGATFAGEVAFVSILPDSSSFWANPNQRLFKTEIHIADPSPEMRPGMSCNVEILVDEIPDATYVPVQAVFQNGGKTICFVDGPDGVEEVEVEVGRDNDISVQILSDLVEGQTVLLAPPAGFQLKAAPPSAASKPFAEDEGTNGMPQGGKGRPQGDQARPQGGKGRPDGAQRRPDRQED